MTKLKLDDKIEQSSVNFLSKFFDFIKPYVKPQILNAKVHTSDLHHFYMVLLHLAPLKWYSKLTFTQHGCLRWGSNHANFTQAVQSY